MSNKNVRPSPTERREHLKQYILMCVRDNVLSWADLASGEAFDKLLKALSSDFRAVMAELGRNGASGLLKKGAMLLGMFAESIGDTANNGRRR